jgi:acyl carrier protein
MIDQQDIQKTVKDFIQQNFIFDPNIVVAEDESLLETGVIDSTGVLELIGYLEEKYQCTFEDNELIGENFDTVLKISKFLKKKLDTHE